MSDRLTPSQQNELHELIHALQEDRITSEDSARLEEWICRDEEARWIYVQYMNLVGVLSWDRSEGNDTDLNSGPDEQRKAKPPSQTPILGMLGDLFQAGGHFLGRSFILTLLLSIGFPAVILLLLIVDVSQQPVPPAPITMVQSPAIVAEITNTDRAVWGKDQFNLAVGSKLQAGQPLQLLKGLAEITFSDGTKTILESPATFEIRDANTGYLRVGRLTASVPTAAHGFTIDTPLARVVDLGTKFGVSVAADGTSETHVFKGKVELAAKEGVSQQPTSTVFLKTGQAAKVPLVVAGKPAKIVRMSAAPERFVHRISKPKSRFAHQGNANPQKEGWAIVYVGKNGLLDPQNTPSTLKPMVDRGVTAWKMRNHTPIEIRYMRTRDEGLTKKIADAADKKGWVVRARIKVVNIPNTRSICFCMYHSDTQTWSLFPVVEPDGTQSVFLEGMSSLGDDATYKIPNSRDRYIDYEIRHRPNAKGADVYVDGKLIATGFGRPRVMNVKGIIFGLQKSLSEARFAKVEWELLDNQTSEEQSRGN